MAGGGGGWDGAEGAGDIPSERVSGLNEMRKHSKATPLITRHFNLPLPLGYLETPISLF